MADYVLSNKADEDLGGIYVYSFRTVGEAKADEDLGGIYVYSFRTVGEAKADAYFLSLSTTLRRLAENPRLGRPADHLLPGLLRHEHSSHAIFYLVEEGGIFVVRILHQAMDAERHIESNGF